MAQTPRPLAAHYILAGGKSRRFGRNKARYRVEGKELILRVADAFAPWAVSTTVVSQTAAEYEDLGLRTIADEVAEAGPLAGVSAAMSDVTAFTPSGKTKSNLNTEANEWILLSSCDLVSPAPSMLAPLFGRASPACRAVVYRRGRFFEPFPGLYHVGLHGAIKNVLRSEQRSFQSVLRQLGEAVATCDWPSDSGPFDMDTPPTGPTADNKPTD